MKILLALLCAGSAFGQADWLNQVKNKPVVDARQFNFTPQQPGGSIAIGSNTITLKPVPQGVNGTNGQYYVYLSGGTGTAESCMVTGGSAVASASSGTLVVTCANTHAGAWTVSSASSGIKEASIANTGWNIFMPAGNFPIHGILVLPTTTSLTGNGSAGTILNCDAAASPCMAIGDGLGTATGQGIGVHSHYQLLGAGSGTGLWIGGDSAGIFAPATWTGSHMNFYDLYVHNFSTTLYHRRGNFVNYMNSFFEGLSRAFVIPDFSQTNGEQQPIEFFGTTLSVLTGAAVQMDSSAFLSGPVHFSGGQVSGAIIGAQVDWDSDGTHYEPNEDNAGIVNCTGGIGVQRVRINGGIMSAHGTALTNLIHVDNSTGDFYLTLKDIWVQAPTGMTITNFASYGPVGGGDFNLSGVDQPFPGSGAGTITNLYSLIGSVESMTIVNSPWNFVTALAAGGTVTWPLGNYPARGLTEITGSTTTISAVAGLIQSQTGILLTNSAQNFAAGASIGASITTTPNTPYTWYFDGTKIWLK